MADADKLHFMAGAGEAPNFPGTQAIIQDEWRRRVRAASVMDKCVSTDWKGRFKGVGTTIERPVLPIVKVNDRKPGDPVKYQDLKGESETFTINRMMDVAYHIDIEDQVFSMKNLESAANKEAQAAMAEHRDLKFFADIYSKCDSANCGANAGVVSGLYNLGTSADPIKLFKSDSKVTAANDCTATEFITRLTGALKEWPAAKEGDVRIVCHSWVKTLLINSELKYANEMGDQLSVLRKGTEYIGNIDGASIIGCDQLPMWGSGTDKMFLVMAFNTKAIQFVDEFLINEKLKDKDQYGDFYRSLSIYDWFADYPELFGYGFIQKG
jgi:hypothetical protein